MYDTFAIVTRAGARLSPGVRELLAAVESSTCARSPDEFDRAR